MGRGPSPRAGRDAVRPEGEERVRRQGIVRGQAERDARRAPFAGPIGAEGQRAIRRHGPARQARARVEGQPSRRPAAPQRPGGDRQRRLEARRRHGQRADDRLEAGRAAAAEVERAGERGLVRAQGEAGAVHAQAPRGQVEGAARLRAAKAAGTEGRLDRAGRGGEVEAQHAALEARLARQARPRGEGGQRGEEARQRAGRHARHDQLGARRAGTHLRAQRDASAPERRRRGGGVAVGLRPDIDARALDQKRLVGEVAAHADGRVGQAHALEAALTRAVHEARQRERGAPALRPARRLADAQAVPRAHQGQLAAPRGDESGREVAAQDGARVEGQREVGQPHRAFGPREGDVAEHELHRPAALAPREGDVAEAQVAAGAGVDRRLEGRPVGVKAQRAGRDGDVRGKGEARGEADPEGRAAQRPRADPAQGRRAGAAPERGEESGRDHGGGAWGLAWGSYKQTRLTSWCVPPLPRDPRPAPALSPPCPRPVFGRPAALRRAGAAEDSP